MQLAANGVRGRAWLDAVPRLIAEARELWSIAELGSPYEGGCVAYVAPARLNNGTRAVLKLCLLDDETEFESAALSHWNGNGAVRLLAADPSRGAMLLEQLEPGTPLAAHPDRRGAIAIACSLLRRLWISPAPSHPFPLVTDLARRYVAGFPAQYDASGRPFPELLLHRAVDLCRHFADYPGPCVLANRDFHLGNVLASQREPWLAIDPKPLVGEPSFDTAHLIRSLLPEEITASAFEGLLTTMAAHLELPAPRMAAWVLVRSLENALWSISAGDGDPAWDIACAAAAERSCHLL